MKAVEVHNLDDPQLVEFVDNARKEAFNLRFQHATGQLEWQPHGCNRAAEREVPVQRIITTMPVDDLLAWTNH